MECLKTKNKLSFSLLKALRRVKERNNSKNNKKKTKGHFRRNREEAKVSYSIQKVQS